MRVTLAATLDEALDAAAEPGSVLLAGGTDAMVAVNDGHLRPRHVVVLNRVRELRSWSIDAQRQRLTLGAATTYREILDQPIAGWVPALAQAARTVGSPQIRHAATIGGNVATASPAGDGLPVLAALDAVIHLRSKVGSRALPLLEFMVGPKRTALQPGELIEAVSVPVLDGYQGYAKVGVRNAMVISAAGVCLAVDRNSSTVRLALGSVGPRIIRCADAERLASERWGHLDDDTVAEFARLAAAASSPIDDHRSTASYRRHAIEVLARRLLSRAVANG